MNFNELPYITLKSSPKRKVGGSNPPRNVENTPFSGIPEGVFFMQKWVAEQFATQRRKAGVSCAGEGFATHSVAKMSNFATQNGILPPKALKMA